MQKSAPLYYIFYQDTHLYFHLRRDNGHFRLVEIGGERAITANRFLFTDAATGGLTVKTRATKKTVRVNK